ncbi:CstA-like transporter-associated (seleno)protein [Kineococcus sp. LSe6-4]|uniref:CstA-like transporter-associated (Seleno)protein n=1 Tax=Kineococcus halophytocola TaxID=3234027 RepID=A0ABV4H312_9ACTN
MRGVLPAVWSGLRWAHRQVDGQDRWEAHLRRCAEHGHPPGSRADFERRRADAKAAVPGGRCC